MRKIRTLFMLTGTTEVLMDLQLDTTPNKEDTVRLLETDYIVVKRGFNIVNDVTTSANNLPNNIVGIVVELEKI